MFIILFLFLPLIYFDYYLLQNIFQEIIIEIFSDYLRINDDLDKSLDNSENISSDRSSSSHSNRASCSCSNRSSLFSEDINRISFLGKYKKATSKIYNKFIDKINNKAKHAAHKIKKFEKTLSWIFKGSKPGGERGL